VHNDFWDAVDSLHLCFRRTKHNRINNLPSTSTAGISHHARHGFDRQRQQPNSGQATRHLLTVRIPL
jgi:hypothetical protein